MRRAQQLLLSWSLLSLVSSVAISAGAPPHSEEIEFVSHGVTLSGSIEFPVDVPLRAAVVFVHGSGPQSRNLDLAARFAREGIVALVYDKRGAGRSGGRYEAAQPVSEQNLSLLADDAAAAVGVLTGREALRGIPVGLAGISQAGWIVPLAAQRNAAVKFLVLWSGPVCKVSEEDIYSLYTHDADAPVVPTYEQALQARTAPYIWPDFLGVDTDPSTSLRQLTIPGLWIFGVNDGSIPVDLSIARLESLRAEGHQYRYLRVPGAGHNNLDVSLELGTAWIGRLHLSR